jgi:hypothetical protein
MLPVPVNWLLMLSPLSLVGWLAGCVLAQCPSATLARLRATRHAKPFARLRRVCRGAASVARVKPAPWEGRVSGCARSRLVDAKVGCRSLPPCSVRVALRSMGAGPVWVAGWSAQQFAESGCGSAYAHHGRATSAAAAPGWPDGPAGRGSGAGRAARPLAFGLRPAWPPVPSAASRLATGSSRMCLRACLPSYRS